MSPHPLLLPLPSLSRHLEASCIRSIEGSYNVALFGVARSLELERDRPTRLGIALSLESLQLGRQHGSYSLVFLLWERSQPAAAVSIRCFVQL